MMQIDIFQADNESGLQQEVNTWLRQREDVEIVHMAQNVTVLPTGHCLIHLTLAWQRAPKTGIAAHLERLARPLGNETGSPEHEG